MAKSLFYQLFGIGKIPINLLSNLQQEGIRLIDEGVNGSVIYQNYRAPRQYARWKRQWLIASIALTHKRLLVASFSFSVINIPLTDNRIRMMNFSLKKNVFCVSYDSSLFHENSSGTIEYQIRTASAEQFLKLIKESI